MQYLLMVGGLLAGCFAGVTALADYEDSSATYYIYFATEVENSYANTKSQTTFDCTQKIYAVIEAQGLPKKKHALEVYWINPRGKRQEYTNFDFVVNDDKRVVWAWLKLHRPAEAILDRVFLQNRAAGMEDFLGQWTAKFHVDGRLVKEGSFTVYC